MNINNCAYCEGCPTRILSKEGDFHENIGNITSQVLFVLPRYDEEAIKDLKEIYSLATGKPFEENCNLTYAVRCTPRSTYATYNNAINYCRGIFYNYFIKHPCKHVFVIGDSWKLFHTDYPNIEHYTMTLNDTYCYLHFYNSLGIKYYDNTRFEAVKDRIIQDIRTLNL